MGVERILLHWHQNCCFESGFSLAVIMSKGLGIFLNCVIPITAIGEWQVWASERQMHRDEQEQSLAKTRGYCTGLEKETSKWNPNKLMNSAL